MDFRTYLSLASENDISFSYLPEEQQITDESLTELEHIIADQTQKNEGVLVLSEVMAARTLLN